MDKKEIKNKTRTKYIYFLLALIFLFIVYFAIVLNLSFGAERESLHVIRSLLTIMGVSIYPLAFYCLVMIVFPIPISKLERVRNSSDKIKLLNVFRFIIVPIVFISFVFSNVISLIKDLAKKSTVQINIH